MYFLEAYFSVIAELEACQSALLLGYKLLCMCLCVSELRNECVYIKSWIFKWIYLYNNKQMI